MEQDENQLTNIAKNNISEQNLLMQSCQYDMNESKLGITQGSNIRRKMFQDKSFDKSVSYMNQREDFDTPIPFITSSDQQAENNNNQFCKNQYANISNSNIVNKSCVSSEHNQNDNSQLTQNIVLEDNFPDATSIICQQPQNKNQNQQQQQQLKVAHDQYMVSCYNIQKRYDTEKHDQFLEIKNIYPGKSLSNQNGRKSSIKNHNLSKLTPKIGKKTLESPQLMRSKLDILNHKSKLMIKSKLKIGTQNSISVIKKRKNPDQLILQTVKVQKLAQAMKEYSMRLNFKNFKYKDYKFVGDKASNFNKHQYQILEIGSSMWKFIKRIPVNLAFRWKLSRIVLNCIEYGTTYTLLKLLSMVCLLAHYFGCGFHYMGQYGIRQGFEDTWIQRQEIQFNSWDFRYVQSVYFAFITASTVGFGDISPVSVQEKIYIIAFTLISCAQFAYVVNIIGSIFQEIAQKEQEFKQRQYDIINYMNVRNICKHQQTKVLKYLDYLNTKKDQGSEKGEQILDLLPKELKDEIQSSFFSKVINQTKVFRLNFSQQSLLDLSLHMKEIVFAPDEVIYEQGSSDTRMFIVRDGKNNNYFGLAEFISKKPRETSARSVGITNAIYIDHQSMIETLSKHQEDLEKFYMMKDLANFSKKSFGQQCISCSSYQHNMNTCPLIFFAPQKLQVIGRFNHSIEGERQRYNRGTNTIRFNSLADKLAVNNQGRIFLIKRKNLEDCLNYEMDIQEGNDKQFCWDLQPNIQSCTDSVLQAFEQNNSDLSDHRDDFYTETKITHTNLNGLQSRISEDNIENESQSSLNSEQMILNLRNNSQSQHSINTNNNNNLNNNKSLVLDDFQYASQISQDRTSTIRPKKSSSMNSSFMNKGNGGGGGGNKPNKMNHNLNSNDLRSHMISIQKEQTEQAKLLIESKRQSIQFQGLQKQTSITLPHQKRKSIMQTTVNNSLFMNIVQAKQQKENQIRNSKIVQQFYGIKDESQTLFLYEMDQVFSYKTYFPFSNYEYICEKIQRPELNLVPKEIRNQLAEIFILYKYELSESN